MDPMVEALNNAARRLREAAREHKRASAAHRRRARETMEALNDLRRLCDSMGIKLEIDGGGDARHGRKQ